MSPGTYQTALANHDPELTENSCHIFKLTWTYLCIGFYFIMFLVSAQLFLSGNDFLHLLTAVEVLASLGTVLRLLLLLGDCLHNLQKQLQPLFVAYKALRVSPEQRKELFCCIWVSSSKPKILTLPCQAQLLVWARPQQLPLVHSSWSLIFSTFRISFYHPFIINCFCRNFILLQEQIAAFSFLSWGRIQFKGNNESFKQFSFNMVQLSDK